MYVTACLEPSNSHVRAFAYSGKLNYTGHTLLCEHFVDERPNHTGQNLPVKRPSDKTTRTKRPRAIQREFVQRAFVRVFVLGLLKTEVRGVRDESRTILVVVPGWVTYFLDGGPGMCDKV